MTVLEHLISIIVQGAVLIPVAFWIGQKWFAVRLQESIKHEYSREIESLRAELRVYASEKEKRSERYYNKQFEVIGELYSRLNVHYRATNSLLSWGGAKASSEIRTHAVDSFTDLIEFVNKSKLYLPITMANDVETYIQEVWKGPLAKYIAHGEIPHNQGGIQDDTQIEKALEKLNHEVKPLLSKLEAEFRKSIEADDAETIRQGE